MPLVKQSTIDTMIKTAVDSAKTEAAKTIKTLEETHTKEILEIKNKTAQEISELTTLKDTAEFSTNQANAKINILEQAKAKSEELLATIQEKYKNASKPKVAETALPTGNRLIRKVNKNGAKMTLEVTADNKKVSCTVETLDGMVKKTTYDPTTDKPITSFSTSSGKARQQKYKSGHLISDDEINVKKSKVEKPYALNGAKQIEKNGDYVTTTIPYSDGSKVKKMVSATTGELYEETIFNEKGEWTKFIEYGKELIKTSTQNDNFRRNNINLKYKNGTIIDIVSRKDDLGVEKIIHTIRYPKDANPQVKAVKKTYCSGVRSDLLIKEERTLKNGDFVTINVNPREQTPQGNADKVHNYKVDSLEIVSKTGEKTLLNREESLNYLKEQETMHIPLHDCNDKTKKHAYV